jgi:hypothetical protein
MRRAGIGYGQLLQINQLGGEQDRLTSRSGKLPGQLLQERSGPQVGPDDKPLMEILDSRGIPGRDRWIEKGSAVPQ